MAETLRFIGRFKIVPTTHRSIINFVGDGYKFDFLGWMGQKMRVNKCLVYGPSNNPVVSRSLCILKTTKYFTLSYCPYMGEENSEVFDEIYNLTKESIDCFNHILQSDHDSDGLVIVCPIGGIRDDIGDTKLYLEVTFHG